MTQKDLILLATDTFVKNVSIAKVISVLDSRRNSVADWVLLLLDSKLSRRERISSIICSLFDRTILEPGETIAYANTCRFYDDLNCGDPFGDVLEVSQRAGHVWIRFNFCDHPISSFEISMYDNEKNNDQ